jgi:hypothetical protein
MPEIMVRSLLHVLGIASGTNGATFPDDPISSCLEGEL